MLLTSLLALRNKASSNKRIIKTLNKYSWENIINVLESRQINLE